MNWPDMTYATSGKKDYAFIGNFERQRYYKQRKYLLWSLRDTLSIANGGINAGTEMIADDSFESKFGKQLTFSQL